MTNPEDTALLMRELLDNKRRAEGAGRWYMEPFLRQLTGMVQATHRWRHAPEPQALAVAYQLLGAVSCFVISAPTLARIFGDATFSEVRDIYPGELRRTLRAVIRS